MQMQSQLIQNSFCINGRNFKIDNTADLSHDELFNINQSFGRTQQHFNFKNEWNKKFEHQ